MKALKIIGVSALLALLGFAAISGLQSCKKVGKGPVVSEERNVSGFQEVQSEVGGDVYINRGPDYKMVVEGPADVLDVLSTEVNGDRLIIRIKNGVFVSGKKLNIHITMPHLTGMQLNGSGNMEMLDTLIARDLSLKISGSGNLNLQHVEAENIQAKISGSGGLNIATGSARSEVLETSGSGSMNLLNLQAEQVDIKISGSGNTRVFVTDYLKAKISGSGNIYYKGSPVIDVDISGSGSLKRI